MNKLTIPLLLLGASLTSPLAFAGTNHSVDLTFDLSTGFYNPSYGDIFYNAPGYAAFPNPVTLSAGDTFDLNYHYLAGQSLEIQHTAGDYQQINMNIFQDFNQGAMGTYNLTFEGVTGNLASQTYSGTLDGQNTLLVLLHSQFTTSSFSFTGIDFNMDITGMRSGSGSPGSTFTTNSYEFQAYGGHVTPHLTPQSVPDTASTLALLAMALAPLGWVAARRRLVAVVRA
ncbi:MAG TPA: hypothetical protein VHE61_17715 [Opitutaceae bacterium]|nr:hypothetical protein [Opitutaceae bacterium]